MRLFAGFSKVLVCAAVVGIASVASANIWIDESFDDGSPLTQGNGNKTGSNAVVGANLDTYDNDANDANSAGALASPIGNVMTVTGTQSASGAFNGPFCLKLAAGQKLAFATPYMKQGNGNFCYLQFAAQFQTIPAAGDAGVAKWVVMRDGVDTTFTVKFVSTGSAVDILAGAESSGTLVQIGTLASAADWKLITMRLQNGGPSETDARAVIIPAEQTKSCGMFFYCSSNTPSTSLPLVAGIPNKQVRAVSFEGITGEMRIDAVYYDGAMEDGGSIAKSGLKAFDTAAQALTGVTDWQLLN
jgi:hypothetical protein